MAKQLHASPSAHIRRENDEEGANIMTTPKPELPYITVDIYDQAYHLSGPDLEQVQGLAARVDARMRAVASKGRTADSLRVAVLAAINLADELARAEERLHKLEGGLNATESAKLRIRAVNLQGLLDSVLEEDRD
jgi:cell division protein ZapA